MAESTLPENADTRKVGCRCRYFKAKVLTEHKMEGAGRTLQKAIDNEGSTVFTNENTSYVNIADYADIHISDKSEKKTTEETLNRVPMAIGNAKRNFAPYL